MAVILTTVSATPRRYPIIGALGPPTSWGSQTPLAEILFAEGGVAITLAGAGDTQRYLINCDLPTGFAYAFMEGSVQLRETAAGDLADWDDTAITYITPNSDLVSDWVYFGCISKPAVGSYSAGSTVLQEATYTFKHRGLQKVMNPTNDGMPRLVFDVSNVQENKAAMTSFYYFRFLQYDLNQGYMSAVNSPTLIR